MKKTIKTTLMMAILLASVFTTKGQSPQVPEIQYKMMYVNPDGSLASLDKSMMFQESKGGAMRAMSGNQKIQYVADGGSSSISHSGKKVDKYIVKLVTGLDPENSVELFKFDEIKKGKRKFTSATVGMGNATGTNSIKLESHKQADGVYVYTTTEDLQPGEYFFLVMKGMSTSISSADQMSGHTICAYCFKVE